MESNTGWFLLDATASGAASTLLLSLPALHFELNMAAIQRLEVVTEVTAFQVSLPRGVFTVGCRSQISAAGAVYSAGIDMLQYLPLFLGGLLQLLGDSHR